MWRLMNKIMLSCEEATALISVKRHRKISIIQQIQLKMHLMVCRYCRRFDVQNNFIDQAMETWFDTEKVHPTEHISQKQKAFLHKVVDEA